MINKGHFGTGIWTAKKSWIKNTKLSLTHRGKWSYKNVDPVTCCQLRCTTVPPGMAEASKRREEIEYNRHICTGIKCTKSANSVMSEKVESSLRLYAAKHSKFHYMHVRLYAYVCTILAYPWGRMRCECACVCAFIGKKEMDLGVFLFPRWRGIKK